MAAVWRAFPLAEEGWRDSLIEAGAPGWSVRRNRWDAGLTTPSAPLRWLRGILLVAQPPLLCEEGNVPVPVCCAKQSRRRA